MGQVRIYLGCSLDGFIAGPNHELDWLETGVVADAPDEGALGFPEFFAQIGVMLMGRRTWDVLAGFDAWHYGDTPIWVLTHRPLESARASVRAVSGPIEDIIAEARAAAGDRDVYVDGGELARQALDAGLVDELTLTLVPILLGDGVPLFRGLRARRELVFADPRRYAGGLVQLRAQVRR
jgi:dihydrofolate reductase